MESPLPILPADVLELIVACDPFTFAFVNKMYCDRYNKHILYHYLANFIVTHEKQTTKPNRKIENMTTTDQPKSTIRIHILDRDFDMNKFVVCMHKYSPLYIHDSSPVGIYNNPKIFIANAKFNMGTPGFTALRSNAEIFYDHQMVLFTKSTLGKNKPRGCDYVLAIHNGKCTRHFV